MPALIKIWFCLLVVLLVSINSSEAGDVKVDVLEVLNCYSLRVQTDAGPQVVRIAEVICPKELLTAFNNAEAKAFLERIVANQQVELLYWATDSQDRLVCQVFLPDGRSLGEVMVAKGYLLPDPYYSFSVKLKELQNLARQNKLGVWQQYAVYK